MIHKILKAFVVVASMTAAFTASALNASYYTSTSKLASGKWVKVRVTRSGIHEITYDQLRQWGFSDPAKVNVYGFGGARLTMHDFDTTIPDDVCLNYTIHTDGKLCFYGESDLAVDPTTKQALKVRRNYYSTSGYYFLSDRTPDSTEVQNLKAYASRSSVVDNHTSVSFFEEELQNPSKGGAKYFGRDVSRDEDYVLEPVTVRDMVDGQNTVLHINYGALTPSSTTKTVLSAIVPQAQIDAYNASGVAEAPYGISDGHTFYRMGATKIYFKNIMDEGEYQWKVRHPKGQQTFLALDNYWFMYTRRNRMTAEDASLNMYMADASILKNFTLEAPANVRVLNVNNSAKVFEYEMNRNDETGVMTGSFEVGCVSSDRPACHVVAFNPAATHPSPEYVGAVQSQNLHGLTTPQMLIITTRTLQPAAEELAVTHRNDGLSVQVVCQDDIFNEFSSGTPDVMAYRRLAKMFYDRDPKTFRYVLLYGSSHYDNRQINAVPADRLLVYETMVLSQSANNTSNYATDAIQGMLNDNFQVADVHSTPTDIAVGRIPASSLEEARQANRKIADYIANIPGARTYSNALMISDDGNANIHLDQSEILAANLVNLHAPMTITRAHNLIYLWDKNDAKDLRAVATRALKKGVGYFSYVGHAMPTSFAQENLWNNAAVKATDYNVPPFVCLSTCDVFAFDHEDSNISQTMLFRENGGAIGVVAAGRTVYSDRNQTLAVAMAKAYATASSGATLGDLWRIGRNTAIQNATDETCINTMCYNLCGDPAVRIPVPEYEVVLTQINGVNPVDVEDGQILDIRPFEPVKVRGYIRDAYGAKVDGFNGELILALYDAPHTLQTNPRRDKDDVKDVTLDESVLMEKTIHVLNGEFDSEFIAPVPVYEGDSNRLVFHADDRTADKRAAGIFSGLRVVVPNASDAYAAGDAPTIESFAVAEAEVGSGTIVPGNITFRANGNVDAIGLNVTSAIGGGSSLMIDDSQSVNGVTGLITVDADGHWSLEVPVADLSDGYHSARLRVVDNAGRMTDATTSFTVVNRQSTVELSADTATPGSVTFDLTHDFVSEPDVRLFVEDQHGNLVHTQQGVTFPYTWNCFEGTDAEYGVYSAYVQGYDGSRYGSSKRIRFTVIK